VARILVVDDAAFMRKMVGDALTKGGHEVVGEAGNGVEAVAQYQALKPEVTTLDITMPEKDGLAALKEIIALDPGARIVMCSALGQESKVLESIKAGAKDFVVKPFQPDRVIEAVGRRSARRLVHLRRFSEARPRRAFVVLGPAGRMTG
jgi:two-component system, chemotaxis family, chemotaxis protein CheY